MLRGPLRSSLRILISLDAVGGIWRYAVDIATALAQDGVRCLLVGSGPKPDRGKRAEIARLDGVELVWIPAPLDWLAPCEEELAPAAASLRRITREWRPDLLHLNYPSQAAGLPDDLIVVAVSHSCMATWWDAVRGGAPPAEWRWRARLNREGFDRADLTLAPSASHACALRSAYGEIQRLRVIRNGAVIPDANSGAVRDVFALAAGRWWDEGKNACTLDRAAGLARTPVLFAGPLNGGDGQCARLSHARAVGELAAADVLNLMERAAVFCAPSRYEPFGLAALEAAARATPLVLADIPTFRELWDGAARFVSADDAAGFARAMDDIAEAPELREELARRARTRALRFSRDRQLGAIRRAYADAMAMKSVREVA